MHTYELIRATASDTDLQHPAVCRPGVEGEVRAAERLVEIAREEYEALGRLTPRMGQIGDDPVEVMADNHLLYMQHNQSAEAVLRAEGTLACALRRLADFNARTTN